MGTLPCRFHSVLVRSLTSRLADSCARQLSVQTLNVAQSAFASAIFPDTFFKDYSVTGNIDNCKILLKVIC